MDGNQFIKSARSAANSCRRTRIAILTGLTASGLLISSSGCAFTKSTWLNSSADARPGAQQSVPGSSAPCACATCALPQHVVMAPQTIVSTPGSTHTFHNPHHPAQPVPVQIQTPPAAAPPAGSQAWLLIPPGGNMPPVSNGQTLAAFPPFPPTEFPPTVPAVPASAAELGQCQKQLQDMNQQINSLRETTEQSRQAMQAMVAEQKNLQRQNQELRKRAERTDQQYLESMESLSQIIGEVISPPAALTPVPASSTSSQRSDQNPPAILLPSVDEEL